MPCSSIRTSTNHVSDTHVRRDDRHDAVSLKDVHLTLPSRAGNVDILRGVDLTVRPGEALGIVGPSGSGKTTLLMVIAGLERAMPGRGHVAGDSP